MTIAVRNQFRDDETQRGYGIQIKNCRLDLAGQCNIGVQEVLKCCEVCAK